MVTCLLGLGSNLGNREGTLRAALAEIDALPDTRLKRQSSFHRFRAIGGTANQGEYLNAAAVVDTTIQPLTFLEYLRRIETRHGRVPSDRWAPRTLDIDLLLYGGEVTETAMLTLPHQRMTFRRFVLTPAAEVAPKFMHPIIGWPVERLLLHLNKASDLAAIVSPEDERRGALANKLVQTCGAKFAGEPALGAAAPHWPPSWTTWLAFARSSQSDVREPAPAGLPYAAAMFPKLTILLDPEPGAPRPVLSKWSPVARQPGRGPTLRIQYGDDATADIEAAAAIESVWPDLARS